MVGNIGIYFGLFFGFLLQWQGPESFFVTLSRIRGLFGKNSNIPSAEKKIEKKETQNQNLTELQNEVEKEVEVEKEDDAINKIHFVKMDGEGSTELNAESSEEENMTTE